MQHQTRRNIVYVLIIGSLLAGLFSGEPLLFNIAYVLIGLLVVSLIWSLVAVRWLRIGRRTGSLKAQVGKVIEEDFSVRNTGPLPKLWLEVRDHSTLPGHRASHVVPGLGPRSSYQWHTETICTSRGEFRLGPMTLVSGDPFGMYVTPRVLNASTRLLVYPAVVTVKKFYTSLGPISGGKARPQRTQNTTTNVAGVRDYVAGDSINRIHWRSSARHSHLMVKEFEIDPLVDIWLWPDFSVQSLVEAPTVQRIDKTGPVVPTQTGIPQSTEEYIAVIAASLAQFFLDEDRTIGFAAYCPTRRVHMPERSQRQMTYILDALASARSTGDTTLEGMLQNEGHFLSRGTTVVFVTSALNLTWLARAKRLWSRGVRPVVVYVDPVSFSPMMVTEDALRQLRASGLPIIPVRYGDDLTKSLGNKPI